MTKQSNCLLQAIYVFVIFFNQGAKIGVDRNSPLRTLSFYCDVQGVRWRFRRKIRRCGNKNMYYFEGYNNCAYIEKEYIFK